MRSATTGAYPSLPRTGLAVLVCTITGVLAAVPASAAVVDPTRPTARVVHGPNCTDGLVRVEVTNGTEPHTVTLQYDDAAAGPATDVTGSGERVTLEGTEVDWGVTVEVSLDVVGPAGDEEPLDFGTYTRPSQEDCDAVGGTPPTSGPTTSGPTTTAPTTSAPTTPPTSSPTSAPPTPSSSTPSPTAPRPTPVPSGPAPSPTPAPSSPTAPTTSPVPPGGTASSGSVSPGSVVTIRGTGFAPGEQVTVSLVGSGAAPLATVTADDEGRVEAVVQIPRDVVLGPAVVQLVGTTSTASTEVALDVAAREVSGTTGRTPWPVLAAGLALLVVAVALAVVAARRPRHGDPQRPTGTAG